VLVCLFALAQEGESWFRGGRGWGGRGWGGRWGGGWGGRLGRWGGGWGFRRYGWGWPYWGARPYWSWAFPRYFDAAAVGGAGWNALGYPALDYAYSPWRYHYIVSRDTEKVAAAAEKIIPIKTEDKMVKDVVDPIEYSCGIKRDIMSCVWPKGKLSCSMTPWKIDKDWKMDKTHMTMKYMEPGWIDIFAHDHKTGQLFDYSYVSNKVPITWSLYFDAKFDKDGWMFKDKACWSTFVSMANSTAWDDFELTVTV